ncbi:FKBP-type peptidyl-prolyl cis-trans isomerase [Mucilaginibacter sp.]|uniref:FKBP-type peptidyl-prolyl cis-trans isomerase n=1 Tax=Mucilaginibacter sp. TaxID=1882438 RepID=UPI0026059205|nr:FKBP-type peptidyl-prolyl cis-trans isomerase [Mucilaginibacter sp.]MDB5029974.1 peptidylprolyl isomerase [Mucilaginibacter sp.]
MKKYFLLFVILTIALSSCKKYDVNKQNAQDDATIQTYLKTNNITAVKDPSGLYYQIITPGGNTRPGASSVVNVNYVGSRLDGSVFDQNLNALLALSQTIQGFQIGVPKIGTGGEIKLFIPSSLGYGNTGSGIIKANTILMFDIKLLGFN